jgi:hypothetical protein
MALPFRLMTVSRDSSAIPDGAHPFGRILVVELTPVLFLPSRGAYDNPEAGVNADSYRGWSSCIRDSPSRGVSHGPLAAAGPIPRSVHWLLYAVSH